jgi:beta-lactamase regulating signal transducer with metallopeptidase domain
MLEWIVLNTVAATALAALVLVLARWRRLRPATRHALWLVVLLKLVTPPVIYWPWPLPGVKVVESASPDEPPTPAATPAPMGPAPASVDDDNGLPLERLELLLAWVRAEREAVSAPPAESPAPAREVHWPDVALAIWVGGGVLAALVQLGRILRFRRLMARGRPAPGWLTAATAGMAQSLGVRPPAVRVLPGIGSPMVWGFGPARLLWPEGLEEFLSPAAREAVLVHELAHLRRRDHWVGWLVLAGGCVWWWHPLFRFVSRQLGREAELACDAWVVGTLPGARRAYAEALLEVSQWVSRPTVPVAALGAAGSRLDFQRRLVMVMREETPCRLSRQVFAAVGVLALLVIPAWTLGQAPAPPPPATSAEPQEKPAKEVTPELLYEYVLQAVAKQPGQTPSDREKKLDELEKKLQALLKELQALKAGGTPPPGTPHVEHRAAAGAKVEYVPVTSYQPRLVGTTHYEPVRTYRLVGAADEKSAEVVLSRANYKLPAAKAEALGAFLREHVKAVVMETKVEGENLNITTTPEAQRTIAQFIALVQGKTATSAHPAPMPTPAAVPPVPSTLSVAPVPTAAPVPAAQPAPVNVTPAPPLAAPPSKTAPASPPTEPAPVLRSPSPAKP